jgi:branched-chain amino acid transport system ATP-binding protein
MSVIENLQMGAFSRTGAGNNAANSAAEIAADIERMLTLFPRLRERTKQLAGTMSGGEQQMLAMSRALMGRPRLLLLDEPSMGLSPILVEKIFDVIRTVSAAGTPILLVEQNARLALGCAHRGYVMESGQITLTDAASVLLNDARVRSAYLGEDGAG